VRSQFIARVALASGDFVYGETFRMYAKYADLWLIMRYGLEPPPNLSTGLSARLLDPLIHEIHGPASDIVELCAAVPENRVALVPAPEGIHFFIGVMGHFVGMIFVEADTTKFPNTGSHRFGHVITLSRPTARASLEEALRSLSGTGCGR
jgi:hypothetical protein